MTHQGLPPGDLLFMSARWRRRYGPAAAVALLALLAGITDAVVAGVDRQPTVAPDGFLLHIVQVLLDLSRGIGFEHLWHWGAKGPLPTVLALPIYPLVGSADMACRTLSALAHAALVVQSYDMGRRVFRRPAAGLLAALLVATSPAIAGFARLELRDVVLAVMVLLAMRRMITCRLERPLPALALGVVLGLGLMTKVAFGLYMVAPGMWLIVTRLRGRRHLAMLGLMALAMVATAGPWAAINAEQIWINLVGSTNSQFLTWRQTLLYYFNLRGGPLWVVLGMVSGGFLVWAHRGSARGRVPVAPVWLLLTTLGVSAALLLFVFDPWTRYAIPAMPVAAMLLGGVVGELPYRVPGGPLRWVVPVGTVGGLVLGGVMAQVRADPTVYARDFHGGLLSPDRREYGAFMSALADFGDHDLDHLVVYDSPDAVQSVEALEIPWLKARLARRAGRILTLAQAKDRLARRGWFTVILVRQYPRDPLSAFLLIHWMIARDYALHHQAPTITERISELVWFIGRTDRIRLGVHRNPGNMVYQTYVIKTR